MAKYSKSFKLAVVKDYLSGQVALRLFQPNTVSIQVKSSVGWALIAKMVMTG